MADTALLAIEREMLLSLAPELGGIPHARGWDELSVETCRNIRILAAIGSTPLRAADMDRFPSLKHIACFAVGIDGVDLAAATARGITVTNAIGANAPDVAEHAMGLLLALLCRINEGQAHIASGAWRHGMMKPRRAIRSMRIGIVGMGAIGKAIAERLAPFGPEIAWWGPRPAETPYRRAESLLALARESDALIVAARADDTNRNLIDSGVLDALGADGFLVNIARGSLVDEDALIAALRGNRLAGAALDVFAVEPAGPEWRDVPRLIAMPHIGGLTFESLAALGGQLVATVKGFLGNLPPR